MRARSATAPELREPAAACCPRELDRHVQDAFEPLEDEVRDVRRVVLEVGPLLREEAEVAPHQCADVDLEPALDRDPAQADRRAAEPVRVAGAGRPLPKCEGDGQVVDLLGRRQHPPRLRMRERPVGRVGKVLLFDRRAHSFRESCEPSVLGADVTLEVGKLPDELGGLVGLGQPRSLARGLAAALLADEGLEPRGLVRQAPCACDERDRSQLGGQRLDPLVDVALEREVRVLEPSFEYALVAGDDHIGLAAVGDEGEAGALEREVPLVRLHGRLDDAPRKLQEPLVEAALEHGRALDKEDDLFDDAGGVAPAADRVESLDDQAAALVLLRLDTRRTEHLDVLVCPPQLDLAAREPVPVGQVAGLEPGHVDLQRLPVELGAQPADGPREAEPVLLPDHRLAEGQSLDDRRELLGQRLRDRPARDDDAEKAVAHHEVLHGDALLAGEPRRRCVPQVLRRALHPAVGLVFGNLGHEQREAPRTDVDAALPQLREPALAQLRLGLATRRGR